MPGISGSCCVCAKTFEVQFRYQMEEQGGGFAYYCSQPCLETSQKGGSENLVTCDACATRFQVELVSNVVYIKGQRRYACSMDCRAQLAHEASGGRLGDTLRFAAATAATDTPVMSYAPAATLSTSAPATPSATATRTGAVTPAAPATAAAMVTPAAPVAPAETLTDVVSMAPAATVTPIKALKAEAVSLAPKIVAKAASSPSAKPSPSDGPRIMAVFNHKGGTGKTTTSVSVAAGLAQRGKKVLLVDTDAQGNVAVSLNTKVQRSLYHVLVMGLPVADAVVQVRPNLDLLPSNESLAAAELYLAGRQNRDRVLSKRFENATADYDYVVLDCSPSLSLMNQNALVLADSVLVPVACDYLSLVGVRQVIRTVKNVNQLLHHPVQIWGVLPTFFDSRAKICREAHETMQQHFGERCLSPIRAAMKVKEAPAQGQTIFEYASGTNAAEDYCKLVDAIIGNRGAVSRQSAASA